MRLPVLRGAVTFVDSVVRGVKALMYSADFYPEEETTEPSKFEQWLDRTFSNKKLEGLMVKIPAKAGTGGRLFGAVTSKEISEALQAQCGLNVAKTKIVQDEPIKSFGTYQLKCKLGYEITGTLNVVVSEEK